MSESMTPVRWREPMLATLTRDVFSSRGWLYERKLDGVRALCVRNGDAVGLWSRNQKDLGETYPEVVAALAEQSEANLLADGEIVAFEGRQTSFARLQPRINLTDAARIEATGVTVYYYLFDLLVHHGADLTALPLRERKQRLREAFDFQDPLRYSAHRNTDGERFYREACAQGWEGLIAKRADARYRHGRSTDWLKFKCVREQEFVVGGFTDPTGSRAGFGALLLGYYEGDRLRYAGKVGTGYDDATLRDLRKRMDALEQDTSPFGERVREQGSHWVSPRLVVQVGFSEWTGDGKLRHPRYTGVREDKQPHEVVKETRRTQEAS